MIPTSCAVVYICFRCYGHFLIFYITRKALESIEDTYKVISSVLNIVRILTVTNDNVLNAF